MFPELAKGIPELDITPYEPLYLKRVSVSKGAGAVTLSGSLYNMTVRGPSQAIPTYSDMRLDENKFNFGIDLPILDIDSLYNLVGKILVLPLVGNGPCKLNLKNVKTVISTDFEIIDVDGRQIMDVTNMKVNFKVGFMHIKLDHLFNGNKVLGQTVNNFLNHHGLEVIGELSDSISESLAAIFLDLMNQIFSKLPLDLWLTD
ncbi:protein takeout-like [Chrysoperla carnea]|uniref:protein takeout-like n=1 Tax=Chrysoperla carnea TaxID=189513 RepID=UPI001D0711F6|nr:protein takeout-like [Chrysoperla carnea]